MIFNFFSKLKKGPKISFKVKMTMFFFLVSLLVELGIIAVVRYQVERANTAENYQYLAEESIVSATTIGEVLWVNLEFLKLLSYNAHVINELIKSNRQYPSKAQEISKRLTSLEKEWLASPNGTLVQKIISNPSSIELKKASDVLTHFNQLYITNKHGGLVGSIKHTNNFDLHQEPWWKFTFNQGKGNIYIGKIKFDQNNEKLIVPFALPVYGSKNPQEIIGIIYSEHSLNDELKTIFNELEVRKRGLLQNKSNGENSLFIHRIYLDNNKYLDYENHQINIDSELTLEKIKKQLESGHKFIYQDSPSYLTAKQITSLETDDVFSQAIDDLGWYLVTITSHNKTALFSLPTRILALLSIGIILLILSILFTLYILNMITDPLKQMIAIADDINNDRFSPESLDKLNKAVVLDNDIGELARIFKNMSLVITSRTKNLQQQIEQLESSSSKLLQQEYLANELKNKARMSILKKSQALRNQISQTTVDS